MKRTKSSKNRPKPHKKCRPKTTKYASFSSILRSLFYGHAAFDVSTLINHFLLKGFYHKANWRPYMLMADNFWQTYRHTADPDLVRAVDAIGGHLLGALLLARIDGKSPAEYLTPLPAIQEQVRQAANDILSQSDPSLEHALDTASPHFTAPSA